MNAAATRPGPRQRTLPAEQVERVQAEHGRYLFNLAYRLLGDRQAAEDVVQETLLRAWTHLASAEPANLRAWLTTVATRLSLNELRRKRRHPAAALEDIAPEGRADVRALPDGRALADPYRAVAAGLSRERVEEAIARLPAPLRAAVVLRAVHGLDYRAIGSALGCSDGAARVKVHRGRQRCQEILLGTAAAVPLGPECAPFRHRIGAWLEGELGPDEAAAVASHVATCSLCEQVCDRHQTERSAWALLPWLPFAGRALRVPHAAGHGPLSRWTHGLVRNRIPLGEAARQGVAAVLVAGCAATAVTVGALRARGPAPASRPPSVTARVARQPPSPGRKAGANGLASPARRGSSGPARPAAALPLVRRPGWLPEVSRTTGGLGSVSFTDPRHGWAAGSGGLILATRDGGATWTPQRSGTPYNVVDVSFVTPALGWAVGGSGQQFVLATTDGGIRWTMRRFRPWPAPALIGVDFVDARRGWAVGAQGTILATADGGATWQAQHAPTTHFLHRVRFVDAARGWAVGNAGTILATADGGIAWTAQASGTTRDLYAISFVGTEHGWAVGSGGTILATADGGATWTAQSSGTRQDLTGVSFVDARHGWAVGSGGTMLATADGGATWTSQRSGTTAGFSDVAFVSGADGWAVGADGVIVATTTGGGGTGRGP